MDRRKISNVYSYMQGDSVNEKRGGGVRRQTKNFDGRNGC